jgi:putative ABC transport system permease protein
MTTLLQDLRYAIHLLRKSAGFTVVAILTLALGIGANSAIFTVVNSVLLRQLPYPEPAQLVQLFNPGDDGLVRIGEFSPQDFDDLARDSKSFSAIASYEYRPGNTGLTLTGEGEPLRIPGAYVSGQFFEVFAVQPIAGRLLMRSDDVVGRNAQVVISESLWRKQFNSDPHIAGRNVVFDGSPFTIVGVAPAQMQFPGPEVDVWAPVSLLGDDDVPHLRQLRWLSAVARLKPGATIPQAHAEANVIMGRLAKMYPDTNRGHDRAVVQGLQESIVGNVRPAMLVLFATVAGVLLIACVNLANLALARGTGRMRELAIRAALGADRSRLVRQILTETTVLSLLGGALGLFIAFWTVGVLVKLGGDSIPRANTISLDGRVVVFTFLVSLATGVLFGLLPALRGAGADFNRSLKDANYTSSEGRKRHAIRSVLIVGEVALAAVLLSASILVVKSLWNLLQVDPGFDQDNILTVRVVTPEEHTKDRQQSTGYRMEILRRVSEVPGVVAVGASKTLPLEGGGEPYGFQYTGTSGTVDIKPQAGVFVASPGYFDALSIPLISGRVFTEDDNKPDAPPRLIVNQALAQKYWPGEDAVGKQLRIADSAASIIGVVGNVRTQGLSGEAGSAIYAPFGLLPRSLMHIYVRTKADPLSIAPAVRQAIWGYEKNQPMEMMTLSSATAKQTARPRFFATLLTSFGALALLLAAIGIYGVISYNVHQQVREIGIRMALGAQPYHVLRMVLSGGTRLAAIGLAIGLAAALLATRAMSSMLFGVKPTDLTSYLVMAAVLMLIAVIATFLPARRATKIDPLVALRSE